MTPLAATQTAHKKPTVPPEVLVNFIKEVGGLNVSLINCVTGISLCTRVTTDTLADASGFSKSHVTNQLNGHRELKPQLKDALEEVFGVDVISVYEQSRRSE